MITAICDAAPCDEPRELVAWSSDVSMWSELSQLMGVCGESDGWGLRVEVPALSDAPEILEYDGWSQTSG